jgi:drug/metabolite transporter (DMT)-like permease
MNLSEIDRHRMGLAYMILAAILWSTGGVIVKSLALNSFQISFYRSLFALLPLVIFFKPRSLSFDKTTLLSGIFYAGIVVLFVFATKKTTAANAILLMYTAPVYVLVLSHFILHERFRISDILVMMVCFTGLILFFIDRISMTGMIGNILGALSGICYAVFTVLLRKKRDQSPESALIIGNGMVVLLAFVMLISQADQNQRFSEFFVSWKDMLFLFFLGVFQIGIPYLLMTLAVKHLRAMEASLAGILEPILNPLWVVLFIGERPSSNAILGGLLILAAVIFQAFWMDWQKKHEFRIQNSEFRIKN